MVRNVAGLLPELEAEDFYLLSGSSRECDSPSGSSGRSCRTTLPDRRRGRVPPRALSQTRPDREEDHSVRGYTLQFEGYDVLALRTFAERETITEFGSPLGVGKESDVYEVRSYKPHALKYHREGYTNFREVHKERDYASDNEHVSWMYTARKAAEREYETLEALYPDVAVPSRSAKIVTQSSWRRWTGSSSHEPDSRTNR